MSRPLRIQYEGAWYHVMNRGANHQNIFLRDHHRDLFLSLLEEISVNYFVEVHCYCLMDNHYHLLICTQLPNLAKAMRHLDGIYTQRFNRLESRDGPLFRGRYKAILVEKNNYLLQVSRYIHLNPVEAKICKLPYQYQWSSFQNYMGLKWKKWLITNFILEMINNKKSDDRSTYVKFVNEGIDVSTKEFYGKKQTPSIYGTKSFIHENLKKLSDYHKNVSAPSVKRLKNFSSIDVIIDIVAKYFNIHRDFIIQPCQGKRNDARILGVLFSRQMGHSYSTIARAFGINEIGIGKSLMGWKQLIFKDDDLKRHFDEVDNLLILPNAKT